MDILVAYTGDRRVVFGLLISTILLIVLDYTFNIEFIIPQTYIIILAIYFFALISTDCKFVDSRTTYWQWGKEDYENGVGHDFVTSTIMKTGYTPYQQKIYTKSWLYAEQNDKPFDTKIKSIANKIKSNRFEQLYLLGQNALVFLISFVMFGMGASSSNLIYQSIGIGAFFTYFVTLIYTSGHPEKTSTFKYASQKTNINGKDIRDFHMNDYDSKGILLIRSLINQNQLQLNDAPIERFE